MFGWCFFRVSMKQHYYKWFYERMPRHVCHDKISNLIKMNIILSYTSSRANQYVLFSNRMNCVITLVQSNLCCIGSVIQYSLEVEAILNIYIPHITFRETYQWYLFFIPQGTLDDHCMTIDFTEAYI